MPTGGDQLDITGHHLKMDVYLYYVLAWAWVCRGHHAICEGQKSKVHSLPASRGTYQSQATRLSNGSLDLLSPVAHPSLSDFY